jgi:AraC-like DNA-binding protein
MRADVTQRLKRRAGELTPSALFSTATGESIEYYRKYPEEVGAVEVHLVTLGCQLSYLRVDYTASGGDLLLGMRMDGDPYKLCVNLSNRLVMSYVEGLGVSPYLPGEVQLYPLTRMAVLVSAGASGGFPGLLVSHEFMSEVATGTGLPPDRGPWRMRARAPDAALEDFALMEGCPLQGGLRRLYIEAKALDALGLLLAQVCSGRGEAAIARALRQRYVRKVHEARDIVHSRLDDLPTLSEMAWAVGMSTTALKKAFRTVFGIPLYAYARNERLKQAKALLAEGELSVGEVADRVGYQSLSYFSAAFKRQFGVLPSGVWRRMFNSLGS